MSEPVANLDQQNERRHVFPFSCVLSVETLRPVAELGADEEIDPKQMSRYLGDDASTEVMAITAPFIRGDMSEVEALSYDFRKEVSERFHPKNYNNGPMILEAYRVILREIYQIEARFSAVDRDSVIIVHDRDGYHLYTYELDPRLVHVRLLNPELRLLDQRKINEIKAMSNPSQLLSHLPPENFEFSGFGVWRRRKFDLYRNFSVLSREIRQNEMMVIEVILQWMKENTGLEKAEVGISIMHDQFLRRYSTPQFQGGSLHSLAQSFKFSEVVNHETLETFRGDHFASFDRDDMVGALAWLDQFNENKLDNVTVIAIWYQEAIVGLIDIAHNEPVLKDKKVRANVLELKSFLELLIANQMTKELSEIESTIRKQCTAIHPVIEWRFHDVAKDYNRSKTKGLRMPPIVFRDVHPLYGVTVIPDSSTLQRYCTQQDFKLQLEDLRSILEAALRVARVPYIEHLLYEVNQMLGQVAKTMEAGDEVRIIAHLRDKIHPALELVRRHSDDVEMMVKRYLKSIQNESGGCDRNRQEFKHSVQQINESIMLYLHQEQAASQRLAPHYFERSALHGVQHAMYFGKSLLRDRNSYHSSQLSNLRLWQMLVMCGAARRTVMLQDRLSIKLQTAHLILVQDQPVSIGFDYDEKKVRLEGHESVRYDLVKNKIARMVDKGVANALVKPGTLTIVYSSDKERHEYLNYIQFLSWKSYFKGKIEEFMLGEFNGLHGLRALRIPINTDKPEYSNTDVTRLSDADEVEWL